MDALSRDQESNEEVKILDEVLAGRLDVCMTLENEDVVRVITIMLKPSRRGKLLYRRYQGKHLLAMPRSMHKSTVIAAHDLGGQNQFGQDFWFV